MGEFVQKISMYNDDDTSLFISSYIFFPSLISKTLSIYLSIYLCLCVNVYARVVKIEVVEDCDVRHIGIQSIYFVFFLELGAETAKPEWKFKGLR